MGRPGIEPYCDTADQASVRRHTYLLIDMRAILAANPGPVGNRALSGESKKLGVYWHLALDLQPSVASRAGLRHRPMLYSRPAAKRCFRARVSTSAQASFLQAMVPGSMARSHLSLPCETQVECLLNDFCADISWSRRRRPVCVAGASRTRSIAQKCRTCLACSSVALAPAR